MKEPVDGRMLEFPSTYTMAAWFARQDIEVQADFYTVVAQHIKSMLPLRRPKADKLAQAILKRGARSSRDARAFYGSLGLSLNPDADLPATKEGGGLISYLVVMVIAFGLGILVNASWTAV